MTGEEFIYKVIFLSIYQEDNNMNQVKTMYLNTWIGHPSCWKARVKKVPFLKMYLKEEENHPPWVRVMKGPEPLDEG